MTDLGRTIEAIRAGRVSRCTRTELLDLCDAAERGVTETRPTLAQQATLAEMGVTALRERVHACDVCEANGSEIDGLRAHVALLVDLLEAQPVASSTTTREALVAAEAERDDALRTIDRERSSTHATMTHMISERSRWEARVTELEARLALARAALDGRP